MVLSFHIMLLLQLWLRLSLQPCQYRGGIRCIFPFVIATAATAGGSFEGEYPDWIGTFAMDELDHFLQGTTSSRSRRNRLLIDTQQLIPDPNSIFYHTRVLDLLYEHPRRGRRRGC